jgi:hypothetical protein
MDEALESPLFSHNEKVTIEMYLADTRQLIALLNARIDELSEGRGKRRKMSRSSRRRSSRRRNRRSSRKRRH